MVTVEAVIPLRSSCLDEEFEIISFVMFSASKG